MLLGLQTSKMDATLASLSATFIGTLAVDADTRRAGACLHGAPCREPTVPSWLVHEIMFRSRCTLPLGARAPLSNAMACTVCTFAGSACLGVDLQPPRSCWSRNARLASRCSCCASPIAAWRSIKCASLRPLISRTLCAGTGMYVHRLISEAHMLASTSFEIDREIPRVAPNSHVRIGSPPLARVLFATGGSSIRNQCRRSSNHQGALGKPDGDCT